jgi:hypothetical protein
MRTCLLSSLCVLFLVSFAAENKKPSAAPSLAGELRLSGGPQPSQESYTQPTSPHAVQVQTPDSPNVSPTPYPQLPSARPSDPAQLKSDAQELQKLADAVPAQIDQVSKGQLSKELIENLKKIEKLSKRLRSEDSP